MIGKFIEFLDIFLFFQAHLESSFTLITPTTSSNPQETLYLLHYGKGQVWCNALGACPGVLGKTRSRLYRLLPHCGGPSVKNKNKKIAEVEELNSLIRAI